MPTRNNSLDLHILPSNQLYTVVAFVFTLWFDPKAEAAIRFRRQTEARTGTMILVAIPRVQVRSHGSQMTCDAYELESGNSLIRIADLASPPLTHDFEVMYQ